MVMDNYEIQRYLGELQSYVSLLGIRDKMLVNFLKKLRKDGAFATYHVLRQPLFNDLPDWVNFELLENLYTINPFYSTVISKIDGEYLLKHNKSEASFKEHTKKTHGLSAVFAKNNYYAFNEFLEIDKKLKNQFRAKLVRILRCGNTTKALNFLAMGDYPKSVKKALLSQTTDLDGMIKFASFWGYVGKDLPPEHNK